MPHMQRIRPLGKRLPKKENNKHSLPAGESKKTLATKNTLPRIKTLAKHCSTGNHETPT